MRSTNLRVVWVDVDAVAARVAASWSWEVGTGALGVWAVVGSDNGGGEGSEDDLGELHFECSFGRLVSLFKKRRLVGLKGLWMSRTNECRLELLNVFGLKACLK